MPVSTFPALRPPVGTPRASRGSVRPSGMSWSALVATTSGLDDFGRLRVRVQASVGDLAGHRLIVQSYAPSAMVGGLPGLYARPLAAAQRTVETEELAAGVNIVLLHSGVAISDAGCVVVAWVEEGVPDLDFDGLCARPVGAVFVGTCHASSERAQVVLVRSAA